MIFVSSGSRLEGELATAGLIVENVWLGGLDSNQDSQSQSLESYQLDDLPLA
jgi:hypothetical protein